MNVNRYIVWFAVGTIVLSGCMKLRQESSDIRTYMVEVERTDTPQVKPLAEKLWMESVHVLPPYNIRNLVLRESDVEFTSSYYTELLMAPADNFRKGFYEWFASSGIFKDVSVIDRQGMSHRMVVSVLDFYGDKVNQEGVLSIKVSLFDESGRGINLLFHNDYSERVKIPETSAEELVRAYNKAFTKILQECEQDVLASVNE